MAGIWAAVGVSSKDKAGYGVVRIGKDGIITETLYQIFDTELKAALAAQKLNEQEDERCT